jgi:crotonobetaine/carnitine-CoA ligase
MNGRYLSELNPADVTIVHLLEERAARAGGDEFFSWGDDVVTVGDFNSRVNRVARNLTRHGIGLDTHVMVLMDTSPDYLALWFAIAKLGAVEVPLNAAYHGEMLRHQIVTGRATVAIVDDSYAARVDELASALPDVEHVVVRGNYTVQDTRIEWSAFDALDIPNDESNLGIEIQHDAVAGVIFTSGTTGPSKGVLLSHHYLAAYGLMYAEVNQLQHDDVIFNFLPFFHLSGKFLTIATLATNARMHLAPRLSVSSFWDDCRRYGITNFIGVGGICNMLIARPRRNDDADTSLRTVYAVPDPADIHEEFEQRFGCRMTTVYGSTEVGLPITRGPNDAYRPGSCGRQSQYYEVSIVDERDNPVPPGTVGEIVVRSKRPYLLGSGYIGMADRTVDSWRNLWLHTGDRGRVDEDGWFWFEDRASDSMRRRGENVSSYEVETLVVKHPAVAEAAAVAAPSALAEDEIWVVVKLREGHQLSYEELLAHCAATMPYFMIPRYFEFVDDFPRTPTAKVEKYKLRDQGPGANSWDREAHGWVLRSRELVKEDGPAATTRATASMTTPTAGGS